MYGRIAEYQTKNADIVIRPNMKNIGSTDMDKVNEAIFEGEKAASAKIPEILKIVNRLKQEERL
jgi:predicted acylesterase/phospholipase RssA